MARTQEFRQLAIATPLGEDVLLLRSMVGTERLGRLYKYRLDLVSEDPSIVLADIVGHNVTVRTQMSPEGKPRHFNGFVSRFSVVRMMGQTTQYRATMVPWLWFLTRTSDCRIFQDMTVPDIIKKVFRDHGFTDNEYRHARSYSQREYCEQYS